MVKHGWDPLITWNLHFQEFPNPPPLDVLAKFNRLLRRGNKQWAVGPLHPIATINDEQNIINHHECSKLSQGKEVRMRMKELSERVRQIMMCGRDLSMEMDSFISHITRC